MSDNKDAFYIARAAGAEDIPLPEYMSAGAAGMDLRANVGGDVTIMPGDIVLVPTGLHIALPDGFEAQVRPRSGLSLRGISMPNAPGTIDADYRGEIKVPIINLGKEPFTIKRFDRIAQMIIARVERVTWELLPDLDHLPTQRDAGGYGSTGVS